MKLRWMVALVAAMGMSVAVAQDTSSEKGKLSYSIGYQLGNDFAERGIEIDLNTVIKAIQDGYAKRNPTVSEAEMREAMGKMQQELMTKAKAEFDKVSAENKSKSDRFLASNRAKTGIIAMPSGIQYRVIEEGTGARPTAASEVTINFRGSIADGPEFVSTYTNNQPAVIKVAEAPLEGLKDVLPLMKTGARWEIFMPPAKAYGDTPRSPIGPNQAVVFDVTLVSVK